ncbi:MAG TPA: hypothetical protein VF669_07110 [Tepidisphaeraceae bacterium]
MPPGDGFKVTGAIGAVTVAYFLLCLLPAVGRARDGRSGAPFDTKGLVTNALAQPVPRANVELIRQRMVPHTCEFEGIDVLAATTCDAKGVFHVKLETRPGDTDLLFIRATADGYGYSLLAYTPETDISRAWYDDSRQRAMAEPWVILSAELKVRGRVVDEDNKPIAGVELITHRQAILRTDAEGEFLLKKGRDLGESSMLDMDAVILRHPDFVQRSIRIGVDLASARQRDGSFRFQLQRGATIQGTCSDADTGKPMAYAQVRASGSSDDFNGFNRDVFCDDRGAYRVHVPANVPIILSASAGIGDDLHYARESTVEERYAPAAVPDVQDFNFLLGRTIHGQVEPKAKNMGLVIGYHVAEEPDNPEFVAVATDGSFAITRLKPGPYVLHVYQAGLVDPAELGHEEVDTESLDAQKVSIALDDEQIVARGKASALRGTVVTPDGTNVAMPIVQLVPLNDDAEAVTVYGEMDGSFACEGFTPGEEYMLYVCDPSRALAACKEVPRDYDVAKPLEIKLEKSCTISGKVFNEAGEPVAGLRLMLRDGRPTGHIWRPLLPARTNERGEYVLRGFVMPANRSLQLGTEIFSNQAHPVDNARYSVKSLMEGESIEHVDFRIERGSTTRVTVQVAE